MRPELINRFDEIISFQKLQSSDYQYLLDRELKTLNGRLAAKNLRLELGRGLETKLINDVIRSPYAGRELKRNFQRGVTDRVSDRLLSEPLEPQGVWILDWSEEAGFEWRSGQGATLLLPAARA